MKNIISLLAAISLGFIFIGFSSCAKDDNKNENCNIEVYYRGTAVCNQGEDAAAISFEDSNVGDFLILSNFFDFIDEAELELNDTLNIQYENVDSTMFNSGILCGPLIVAPVAELTCLEKI